jgi:hypothetical protein
LYRRYPNEPTESTAATTSVYPAAVQSPATAATHTNPSKKRGLSLLYYIAKESQYPGTSNDWH